MGASAPILDRDGMSTEQPVDPIGALEALGLPNYEAKVFVALQKLGTGTAKEVGEVADVPRSQVYGTAESLEERGLIEIQQSTPKSYRPVPLDEAKQRLEERFETNSERAFSYLEQVKDDRATGAEQQEGVWRLSGTAPIESRMVQLVDSAAQRIIIGLNQEVEFTPVLQKRLEAQAQAGRLVVVLAEDPAAVPSLEGVHVQIIPSPLRGSEQSGRLLLVDEDTILLSVLEDDGTETAVWSARSGFARVLIPLVEDAALAHADEPAE